MGGGGTERRSTGNLRRGSIQHRVVAIANTTKHQRTGSRERPERSRDDETHNRPEPRTPTPRNKRVERIPKESAAALAGFIDFDVGAAAVIQCPSNNASRKLASDIPAWAVASWIRLRTMIDRSHIPVTPSEPTRKFFFH